MGDAELCGASAIRLGTASIAMDHGRWVESANLVKVALALFAEHRVNDYAIAVFAFAGAARPALHGGEPVSATRELMRAMRARKFCALPTPALAVPVRMQSAKTYVVVKLF